MDLYDRFSRVHSAQDFRFFIKIPESIWDSKRFVLDSSWCWPLRLNMKSFDNDNKSGYVL